MGGVARLSGAVVGAVILVALILGLPFVIGLFLGRAWGRGALGKKATTEAMPRNS